VRALRRKAKVEERLPEERVEATFERTEGTGQARAGSVDEPSSPVP
jgi:hypothetical protein